MTRHRQTSRRPRAATVYGEPSDELLRALAAVCGGGRVLRAGAGRDQDMLTVSVSLPPSAGGCLRRALLRSQADLLRRQADGVGAGAPAVVCQHCLESEAMRSVVEQLQRVARTAGVTGSTVAERALLLGQVDAAAPCRCRL